MEPVLYDIKDAARYLGVAPSTLRYWEREGLVRAGRNRGNDYRQYALHDLIDASEIAFYRRLGVPVRELAGYRTLSARDLDDALDRTARDVEQRIAEGQSAADAEAEFLTDDHFEAWYQDICSQLKQYEG
ncbi:MerR family transcriptional regulator [Gordonibacter pamelaeae]|uniref:MerR family transcriptional regulator n=1 Tax=Gordonibacter pamelaeae TaxID=471189 RepID=UPI003A94DB6D